MFLAAAGIIYGKTGTLNMADIAYNLANTPDATWVISSSMLLLVSFGLKAGIFIFSSGCLRLITPAVHRFGDLCGPA